MNNEIELRFGIGFEDLYRREGLVKLDEVFLNQLKEHAPALYERLLVARENPPPAHDKAGSELIIELAPHVEDFIGELFGVKPELSELRNRHTKLAPIFAVKRKFVQRKALTAYTEESASAIDGEAVAAKLNSLSNGAFDRTEFRDKGGAMAKRGKRTSPAIAARGAIHRVGHSLGARQSETQTGSSVQDPA